MSQLSRLPSRIARVLQKRVIQQWPGRVIKSCLARPMASITFDDFAQSAWTIGGPILESAGARGTYFVSGSYCGLEANGIKYFDAEDLVAAHSRGHEIACHTFDHRAVSKRPALDIEASLQQNREFTANLLGNVGMTSFAFPYGDTS